MLNNASGTCEKGSRTEGRGPFTSGEFCSLDCSWMLFWAYYDKHLDLIYQVFILVGRRNTTIELIWPAYLNLDMASCLVFMLAQI